MLNSVLMAATGAPSVVDLAGRARDPFAIPARVRVLIFARVDCPITNRYAGELDRLVKVFRGDGADFWMVYPDPSVTPSQIRMQMTQYGFTAQPIRDPQHELVKRAKATTAPEAAVFDSTGKLVYHGRIDDFWAAPGKARPAARTHDLEDAIAAVMEGRPVANPSAPAIGCSLADVK